MAETTTTDLPQRIAEILGEVVDRDPEGIEPGQSLAADLGVDSLAMIEVVLGVEQQLGVVIADDDVAGLGTVAELTAYVGDRVG
jgi:acyl carrier protein